MATDYAAEFDATWPDVAKHLPQAWSEIVAQIAMTPIGPAAFGRMRRKAQAGHIEHSGDIFGWKDSDYERAIREEMDDLVVYRAYQLWNHDRV